MARTDIDLKKFRASLEQERKRILNELQHVGDRTHRRGEALEQGEQTQYDQDMADLATETYEREKDLLTEEQLRDLLMDVETALENIDSGTYGECRLCGTPISAERLETLPYASYCIACQNSLER